MKRENIFLFCVIACLKTTNSLSPFTLEEFVNSEFVTKDFDGIWVGGNKFLYKYNAYYMIHEIGKIIEEAFLKEDLLSKYANVSKVYPSGDLLYGLVEYNVSPVYRHSKTAQYVLYKKGNPPTFIDISGANRLQLCKWAGNNSLVYVSNNNIYYMTDVATQTITQITNDGKEGEIYNGVPDWVYEEEVLASDTAIWFSPDRKALVFAKFNDEKVTTFSYVKYGEPSSINSYPEVLKIKYPKVGSTNPTVKLFFYDLTKTQEPKEVITNMSTDKFIMNGVVWNVTDFFVLYTNRIQNEGKLLKCKETSCDIKASYASEDGWLDVSLPVFNKNGSAMAQIQPYKGFQQLWLTTSHKADLEVVTFKNKTVVEIYGVDGQVVYYSATVEKSHYQRHLYSYDHRTKVETCLSCNFKIKEGTCTYVSASFSTDLSHYAQTCQGPYPNFVTLENVKKSASETWEQNENIRNRLVQKYQPGIQDLIIQMDGYEIAVRLLLPPNFDKNKKYPMIVNVYAGPNSNQITDKFSVGFEKYVVTNMRYIYAYIDGRGSGLRGNEIKHKIYKKLGTVEIEDQISATKKLLSMHEYIDKSKVCIWGWSYGGFATAWALVKDVENVFKCGVSVAPVTNFYLYDSVYTERYMSTVAANKAGYEATDLMKKAAAFKGKKFFLIHGNADDNVHYQQSMLLSRALELSDVHFQQMSYPEENHKLKGVLLHLYHEITKFWQDSFAVAPVADSNGSTVVNLSMMVIYLCSSLLLIVYRL